MRERKTFEELKELADLRHRRHRGQSTSRPLSEDYELVGIMAEEAFAWRFGLSSEQVERDLVGGDGGVDFVMEDGTTIDVKASAKPNNLLLEDKEWKDGPADIIVQSGVDVESRRVSLLGWEYGKDMLHRPSRPFNTPYPCHYQRIEDCRPMVDLYRMFVAPDELVDSVEPYAHVKVGAAGPIGPPMERNLWETCEFWTEEALDCERAIGREVARLYPWVGDVKPPTHPLYGTDLPRRNRVRTSRGAGLLLQAFDGDCLVLLDGESARATRERDKAEKQAEAEAKKAGKKKKNPRLRYGKELPAGIRLHHRDVVPE